MRIHQLGTTGTTRTLPGCAHVIYSRGVYGQIEWELLFTNFPTRALYSCTVGSFCMHVAGSVLRMMRMSNVKFCCVVFFHITSLPIKWVAWEHVPCMFHLSSVVCQHRHCMEWPRIACQEVPRHWPRIRARLQCKDGDRALSIFPSGQSGQADGTCSTLTRGSSPSFSTVPVPPSYLRQSSSQCSPVEKSHSRCLQGKLCCSFRLCRSVT